MAVHLSGRGQGARSRCEKEDGDAWKLKKQRLRRCKENSSANGGWGVGFRVLFFCAYSQPRLRQNCPGSDTRRNPFSRKLCSLTIAKQGIQEIDVSFIA